MTITHLIACCLLLPLCAYGQKTIELQNPSFEDNARCCIVPYGWTDCGSDPGETPPDIQPGSFQVKLPASDGNTYLGLVVRDNNTWEGIGQRLSAPLLAGYSYQLEADLARSEILLSLSRSNGKEVNYATPVKLRIWGGASACERTELLAESQLVTPTDWRRYTFDLNPVKGDYEYLILEAYYKEPVPFPYNGNVLVDHVLLTEF